MQENPSLRDPNSCTIAGTDVQDTPEPIKKVARMIRNHPDGVVGWVGWQISNGRLEGMNNRIRLLSHRSFGLYSAEALISLAYYLCCSGLTLQKLPRKVKESRLDHGAVSATSS